MTDPRAQKRSFANSTHAIFWVGFVLRMLWIVVGHTYRFRLTDANFSFGWETGRIAAAIARGEGFSSPFASGTGPTAWVAPLFPYLLAGVFKIFGVYTQASAFVILTLNAIPSAATAVLVFHIARRSFNASVARWSAWIWALVPYAMYWAVRWPWETALSTLLLAACNLQALRMAGIGGDDRPRGQATAKQWALFGLLWGVTALLNPSLCLWLPFCGVWLLIRDLRRGSPPMAWRNAVLSGVIFLALLAPWTVRNYRVFHKLIPLRGNFGVEFHLGNSPTSEGLWQSNLHPSSNDREQALYRRLGEVAYVHSKLDEAKAFVREHPGRFIELCLRRAFYYWFNTPQTSRSGAYLWYRHVLFGATSLLAFAGIFAAYRRRVPARFLYASLLLSVSFIYYLTFPHPRYRAPLEPQIAMLCVYAVQSAERRR